MEPPRTRADTASRFRSPATGGGTGAPLVRLLLWVGLWLAIVVLAAAGFAFGVAVGMTAELTPENWRRYATVRLVVTAVGLVGAALIPTIAIPFRTASSRARVRDGLLGLAPLSFLAGNFAPLRDLVQGPAELAGAIERVRTQPVSTPAAGRRYGSETRYRHSLVRRDPGGRPAEVSLSPPDWRRLQDRIRACGPGAPVEISVLRGLERILRLRCGASLPAAGPQPVEPPGG